MSSRVPAELERSIDILTTSNDSRVLDQALATLSDASATLELRPFLQDASLFERLIIIFATIYSPAQLSKHLFRCIGNLVSDNEANRTALIGNSGCTGQLKTLLVNYIPGEVDTHLEDFAVKIFFNLCNDSPETQEAAVGQAIHEAVLIYVCARTWTDDDEMLLSIATSLLANLFEQKTSVRPSEDRSAQAVENILRLPFIQQLDSDAFSDVLGVISVYLQDETFTSQIVQHKQIHLVFDILILVENVMRRECGGDEQDDDNDEKQYRNFLNAFAQSLADLSSLPAFNDAYTVEDNFMRELCRKCIPSEVVEQQASLAPGCACLILGNLAVTDEVSTALASDMVPVENLLQVLGSSNDSVFLNAAAGLLRHLAIPMENRMRLFESTEALQRVVHLYTDVTLEQVQIAGLQLTRQIVTNMPERTARLIDQGELPSLHTFTTLFTQTTSTATKLEISRLITIILRTLQAPSASGGYDATLKTLVNHPDILAPPIFAIKQAPAPAVMTAQAEGWLALNLFVRAPGGAAVLAAETSRDEELFPLLCNRIKQSNIGAVVTGIVDDATHTDTRPEWVREKERDNAVLLVHDLLKADDVEENIKKGLKTLLEDSNIRIG